MVPHGSKQRSVLVRIAICSQKEIADVSISDFFLMIVTLLRDKRIMKYEMNCDKCTEGLISALELYGICTG